MSFYWSYTLILKLPVLIALDEGYNVHVSIMLYINAKAIVNWSPRTSLVFSTH